MSTPEERIARLEARMDGQDDWLRSIAGDVRELRDLASAGGGALKVFVKIGAVLAVVLGGIWAVVTAAINAADKFPLHR